MRNLVAITLVGIVTLGQVGFLRAEERRLPDGTKLSVRLMEQLSSATAKDGDQVNFTVVEDFLIDGVVVIKQGTPAKGVIVEAAEKRRMGRAGKLAYSVTETRATDRSVVRLRAVSDKKGGSNVTSTAITTTAVAVFVPVAAPFFLLRKGKDIVIAEGTRVEAFVDGDHVVQSENVAVAAQTQPTAASGPKMTNADVLSLHAAGLGEAVLLSKIATSDTAFSVNASDLVELKKAGVSDKVIAAMLQPAK